MTSLRLRHCCASLRSNMTKSYCIISVPNSKYHCSVTTTMTSESTVTNDFTSIPILNYALLSSPDTRSVFIRQLQHTLINVGFLYLENNTPVVPDALFDKVIAYLPRIFALPQERKDAMRMINSPYFLGYSRLGVERTRGAADQREQFDFATPFENEWVLGQPEYVRLWGPSQVGVFFFFWV
jgi:isopenicillin N synthase-like dioxygenase